MKAVTQHRFGPPGTLRLTDIDLPEAGPGDVVIRVCAAALNPYDWHVLRGDPMIIRLVPGGPGLTRPSNPVAGIDAAGIVETVGANVRGLQAGDEVFGFFPGAFAEYARAAADKLAPKPASLTFEQAAALPMAATTALRGIRKVAKVQAGQRVLINGAAGGVGTFAVQVAAALGAEVTGVCRTSNVELVRSLGAAAEGSGQISTVHVIDYTKDDFTARREAYDVILDNVGNRPLRSLRRALTPTGTLVINAGGSPGRVVGALVPMAKAAMADRFVRQRLKGLPVTQERAELVAISELVEDGRLTPVIDRTYPLADTAAGLSYVEQGHARGKVVITVP